MPRVLLREPWRAQREVGTGRFFMGLLTYPLARFFLRDHRRNAGLLVHALSYPHGFLEASGQYLPRME